LFFNHIGDTLLQLPANFLSGNLPQRKHRRCTVSLV
jgi:hypothetical protein